MCKDKLFREISYTIGGSDENERYNIAKKFTIRKCKHLGRFRRDRVRPISVEFVHK